MKRVLADRQPTSSVRCQGRRRPGEGFGRAAALGLRLAVLAAITAAAAAGLGLRAGADEKAEPKAPQSFDEATAAAWKKAGADVGWMGNNDVGILQFGLRPEGLAA